MIYVPVISVFFFGLALGAAVAGLMYRRALRRFRAAVERLMDDHRKATDSQIELLRKTALRG